MAFYKKTAFPSNYLQFVRNAVLFIPFYEHKDTTKPANKCSFNDISTTFHLQQLTISTDYLLYSYELLRKTALLNQIITQYRFKGRLDTFSDYNISKRRIFAS